MKSATKNKRVVLTGRVKSGLGEGRYYMSQKGYRAQFAKRLGIDPYPGTLNLRLSAQNEKKLIGIKGEGGVAIKGFKKGGKTFWGVVCYRAEISGIRCALVMPERSAHSEVAEIISAEHLRRRLKLRDGSMVKVSVSVPRRTKHIL